MRLKEGFVLRRVAGQAMVIATGEASREFHGMIKLNRTGEEIWEGLEKGMELEEIAELLTERFDITMEEAQKDTEAFAGKMQEAGFLV